MLLIITISDNGLKSITHSEISKQTIKLTPLNVSLEQSHFHSKLHDKSYLDTFYLVFYSRLNRPDKQVDLCSIQYKNTPIQIEQGHG